MQHNFPKMGAGSKTVWILSKNSFNVVFLCGFVFVIVYVSELVFVFGEYAGGGLGLLTIPAALPLLLFLLPQSSSPPPPPAPQPRMLVLPNATLVPALLPSGRSPQPPPSSPPPPPCPSSPCQSLGLVTLLPVFTSLDGGLVRPRGLAHSSSE